MIGLTDRERELAVTGGGHPAAFGLALAELSLYWDSHPAGAPLMHQPVLNIRASSLAEVEAVAAWLGVPVHERHKVHHAQRRFGTGEDSILVEAHFTPDFDAAFAAMRDARKKDADAPAEAEPELAGTGRAA